MANQLVIHCQSKPGLLIEDNFCCHFYHSMFSSNALDYRRIQEVLKVTANQNKTILVWCINISLLVGSYYLLLWEEPFVIEGSVSS